jgi:glycosyltransferase involved in cell wall biosynthesis
VSASVLIPVFNRRDLVGRAIESALRQGIPDLDVVVVDNHSDDGTWEVLQSYSDPRVRLLRNESNIGLFGNFNRCAQEIRRPYALFLCSDDRLEAGFLGRAIALMERFPQASLLSSRGVVVGESGNSRGVIADSFPPGLYHGSSVPSAWFWANYHYGANPLNFPSGILMRSSALNRCLPFRVEFGAAADMDLFLRVLGHGDLLIADEIGCLIGSHAGQESRQARSRGTLIQGEFTLLAAWKAQLQRAGSYDEINRQMTCMILGEALRNARRDLRQAVSTIRSSDRGLMEMLNAALRRLAFRIAHRIRGARVLRYLEPVLAAQAIETNVKILQ